MLQHVYHTHSKYYFHTFLSTTENWSKNYSRTAFKFQTHTISDKLFSYTKLNPTIAISLTDVAYFMVNRLVTYPTNL